MEKSPNKNQKKTLEAQEYAFLQRRRWAKVGVTYVLMLVFMMIFLSPLLFSALSSVKTNPLEYPPNLNIPQLNPVNWFKAGSMAARAGGSSLTGGFAPGHEIDFEVQYFVPDGLEPEIPEAAVPRRQAGAGLAALRKEAFAADHISVVASSEIERQAGVWTDESGTEQAGLFVSYSYTIRYDASAGAANSAGGAGAETTDGADAADGTASSGAGDGDAAGDTVGLIQRVPLDILSQPGQIYVASTIPASRIERRGRVASYDSITPGFLGYTFYNYFRVFTETQSLSTGKSLFGQWFLNSTIVAALRVVLNLVFASMAGYALARYSFKGRGILIVLLLGVQVLPAQVTFISNFLIMRDGIFGISRLFGAETLLNTLAAVILPGAIEAAKVFIMKQFFESLPRELEEAAYSDGAGHFLTFFRIMLPISRPALGAVTILTFQGSWNDFFWPLIVLTTPEDVRTLPIGILYFRQLYGAAGDWGLILSGAMLSAIPVIVLFVVFQKYFLQGMSFGGSKG